MYLASKWLRDCDEGHRLCCPHGRASILRDNPPVEDKGGAEHSKVSLRGSLEHHAGVEVSTGPDTSSWYPSRLIDIDDSGIIRIVQTNNRDISEPYMTLSHCWGNYMPTKLTTSTKAELENGFRTANLPKTFQEAVFVTRQMGLRYLWIGRQSLHPSGFSRRLEARVGNDESGLQPLILQHCCMRLLR